jgi:ubiquinone/menaquinone biosynthesis C-methylase UbiE
LVVDKPAVFPYTETEHDVHYRIQYTAFHPTVKEAQMPSEDVVMQSEMARMANSYDSYMRKVTLGREHVLRELTVNLAQIQPGDQVLEVGCGTGTLSLAAKQKIGPTGKVYGIDMIPQMIELSRRKAAQAGADITFQLGSIEDIPFPANQFDAVLCSFMIFHTSEAVRQRGIREIQRVLKPQGRLLVLDITPPARSVQRVIANTFFGGFMRHDLRELLPLLEASGFIEIEIAPADFRIFFLSIVSFVRARAQKS